jgi:hypothetical protein
MSLTKRKMDNMEWDYTFEYNDYLDDNFWTSNPKKEKEWKEYKPTDWNKYEPVRKNYPIFEK